MQELKEKFHNASSSATAGRLSSFQKYQRLIIDEVGYRKMDEAETRLFFQMGGGPALHVGKGSIILTSNRDIADWSEFFSDMDALECALDRPYASPFQERVTEAKEELMFLWILITPI